MSPMFTERARRVILFAQEEAGRRGECSVGTEHILLGLLREDDSVAFRMLLQMRIDPMKLRSEIERSLSKGDGRRVSDLQLTARAKHAIDFAYDEARRLGNDYIGTEHLLLGLVRETDGQAARILSAWGADVEKTRAALNTTQGGNSTINPVSHIDDSLRGRDLLSIRDLSADEVRKVFQVAAMLKGLSLDEQVRNPVLPGKTLAMIFEKPSLRTRVTFETGMTQLGGHAIYLQPSDIQMGKRETVADTARNLERWVQGIMIRTFGHDIVLELAKYAGVPVINGLSDLEHPCQALADIFTLMEHRGEVAGSKLAYIGDGCNTCHSLMLLCAKLGIHMTVGCPEGYEPDTAILTSAQREARETGAQISVVNDPFKAVEGANAIYTDVWASMGLEAEAEKRKMVFQPYQVNQQLVDAAADDVKVLHCLPAHRGEEITDEVLDGPRSIVLDEAENRLHVQKAILALVM